MWEAFWDELTKIAAFGGDLRVSTFEGSKSLTNPPTEDSKQVAFKNLSNAQKPGKFLNKTEPKHLVRPGPAIKQVAPLPR